MGQSVGGRKWENPEKKHLAHPQAELGLSHVARAGPEPTPDIAEIKICNEKSQKRGTGIDAIKNYNTPQPL